MLGRPWGQCPGPPSWSSQSSDTERISVNGSFHRRWGDGLCLPLQSNQGPSWGGTAPDLGSSPCIRALQPSQAWGVLGSNSGKPSPSPLPLCPPSPCCCSNMQSVVLLQDLRSGVLPSGTAPRSLGGFCSLTCSSCHLPSKFYPLQPFAHLTFHSTMAFPTLCSFLIYPTCLFIVCLPDQDPNAQGVCYLVCFWIPGA